MRLYETMLMIDPRLESAQIDATIERFGQLVGERGGQIQQTERWGRRRLAYEIDHLEEAYYVLLNYDLPPDQRQDLEAALPFVEGLMRSKTVHPAARTRRTDR